MVMDEKVT